MYYNLYTDMFYVIHSSYDRSFDRYQDHESQETSNYGYNYNNYRPPPSNSLKGKMESKYWHTKQSVIQKLGKEQDVFVVAGDAEVDARLEVKFTHSFVVKPVVLMTMYN